MRYLLLASLSMVYGCCCHRFSTCPKPNPVKWAAESGLSTSLYPNAPCDAHPYWVDKVDLSFKLRREW